ncbi:hypothetical protein EPD60_14280 [Flaviaesturariibacter flavus]|uniref:Uncharacterized protein n=1 Tax=Flaviaesturariibacter flavus TaxID=2502780 RepID=A0A4R1B4P2_9BACT|nr:hypothetical protein [Flaviaesturariibacter flavus]TCJ12440.1 hypothetical protein EPD60_14280 [Flaviaesturariibacter flavus]
MATNYNPAFQEGKVAAAIEKQTAKIPSDVYLWTAVACMGVSLALQIARKQKFSLFIGQWPAAFLIMGLYNKLVKLEGTDGTHQNP